MDRAGVGTSRYRSDLSHHEAGVMVRARRIATFAVVVCLASWLLARSAAARQPEATAVGSPAAAALPAATAPLGLGSVPLPDDRAGVEALLARMPPEVAGESRAPAPPPETDRLGAAYGADPDGLGPPLAVGALDLSTGDFFPAGWTAGDYVALVASGATDFDQVLAFGRDGGLVWLRANTTAAIGGTGLGTPEVSRTLYTLSWGDADSACLFSAAADTPERLDALVAAFVGAQAGGPGTPPASGTPVATSGSE